MNKLEQEKFEEFVKLQEKPLFILIMGMSGSGKTALAKQFNKKFNIKSLSFEGIRKELERSEVFDVGYNEIFTMASERIRKKLEHGESIILDSPGLNSYRRAQFLKTLRDIDCVKACVMKMTDYDSCVLAQDISAIPTEEDIIWKQYESFQVVTPTEGWDYVARYILNKGPSLEEIFEIGKNKFTKIFQHLEVASQMAIDRGFPSYLVNAIKYHDIGKFFSKIGEDEQEEEYIRHENIGAYLYTLTSNDVNWLYISNLILWHEVGYEMTTEKRNKIQKRFGKKFLNDLILLSTINKESKNEVIENLI